MKSVVTVNVKLTQGPRLLGLICILAGILSILSPQFMEVSMPGNRSLWIGLVFMLAGLLISGIYRGTEIDISGKRFRNYQAYFGIKTGEWNNIPDLDGIYLFSQSEEFANMPNGITPTLSGTWTDFYVMAISKEITPVFSLVYTDRDPAQSVAERLSQGLGVSLK